LKLQYDKPLFIFAFNFNFRRYRLASTISFPLYNVTVRLQAGKVGRCSLTLIKPTLKPPGIQRLTLKNEKLLSNFSF
jgi:hypothetical protein